MTTPEAPESLDPGEQAKRLIKKANKLGWGEEDYQLATTLLSENQAIFEEVRVSKRKGEAGPVTLADRLRMAIQRNEKLYGDDFQPQPKISKERPEIKSKLEEIKFPINFVVWTPSFTATLDGTFLPPALAENTYHVSDEEGLFGQVDKLLKRSCPVIVIIEWKAIPENTLSKLCSHLQGEEKQLPKKLFFINVTTEKKQKERVSEAAFFLDQVPFTERDRVLGQAWQDPKLIDILERLEEITDQFATSA